VGYEHLLVFASAAAVGADLAVNVDHITGYAHLSEAGTGAAVTVPVAIYLLPVWIVHLRPHQVVSTAHVLVPLATALVLGATFTGHPVVITGLLVAGILLLSTQIEVAVRQTD
jgi:low temperature requirement A protein (LtrA)